MFQMLDVFAEFEAAMIRERVRAGVARATPEGLQVEHVDITETRPDRFERTIKTDTKVAFDASFNGRRATHASVAGVT